MTTLSDLRWFGDGVLRIAPEPRPVFDELLRQAADRWPEHPPYGGVHDQVVPHLTIGDNGDTDGCAAAAAAIGQALPIRCRVDSLEVWVGGSASGSWRRLWSIPLGA